MFEEYLLSRTLSDVFSFVATCWRIGAYYRCIIGFRANRFIFHLVYSWHREQRFSIARTIITVGLITFSCGVISVIKVAVFFFYLFLPTAPQTVLFSSSRLHYRGALSKSAGSSALEYYALVQSVSRPDIFFIVLFGLSRELKLISKLLQHI